MPRKKEQRVDIEMVRTINDESCGECGGTTNWYDPNMGRLCPKCTAKRCAQFGKGLAQRGVWPMDSFHYPEDMSYLASSNIDLLTIPMIDHSDDIEVGSTVYHTVKPALDAFIEKSMVFKNGYVSKKAQKVFWDEINGLVTKIGIDVGNHFAVWYRKKDEEVNELRKKGNRVDNPVFKWEPRLKVGNE